MYHNESDLQDLKDLRSHSKYLDETFKYKKKTLYLKKEIEKIEIKLNNGKDKEGSLIEHLVPDYVFRNNELLNKCKEIFSILLIIDKLYINVKKNRSILMIINGLYISQFALYTRIVVILTLFIAISNLIMGSLVSYDIPDISITLSDIFTGILGVIVASIANFRDKKDESTHALLTAMNNSNDFLIECEKYVMNLTHMTINNEIYTDEDIKEIKKVSYETIIIEYSKIIKECSNIINTFSSQEAKILINGPLNTLSYMCCVKRKIYDPKYLKIMVRSSNDGVDDIMKIIYHETLKNNNILNDEQDKTNIDDIDDIEEIEVIDVSEDENEEDEEDEEDEEKK